MNEGRTIALLGPTGVGKTAVAVELAELLGVKIVSCDSMQVYEGFPVLTNQPWRPGDRRELHRLVGILDPKSTMSAGEYAELAGPLLSDSVKERGSALIVGGSGLYMRAALAPLEVRAPGGSDVRSALEDRARTEGPEGLHAELSRVDPEAAAVIDARNVRRVVRALEGVMTYGVKWSGREDLWQPKYYCPTLVVGLVVDRSVLAANIAKRTELMLTQGAVEEVARYRKERGEGDTMPGRPGICSAIGYREICDYLNGELQHPECLERMAAATRRYARRQGTWLRRVRDAVMIDTEGREPAQIAEEIVTLADSTAQ